MGRIPSDEKTPRHLSFAEQALTPSEEEQTIRILKGLCPHNQGWWFVGFGHNSSAYRCNLCDEVDHF